jgi:hypothetical protein
MVPANKRAMLNLRVYDLNAVLERLRGVDVDPGRKDYGRFLMS